MTVQKALEEAEDRFEFCDNCERPAREGDLKIVWCREPESGEQVDARICAVCRLEVERDELLEAIEAHRSTAGYFCNKCGYLGSSQLHLRAGTMSQCHYAAAGRDVARLGDEEHVRELAERALRDDWNCDGFTAEQANVVLGEAVVLASDRLNSLRSQLREEVERLKEREANYEADAERAIDAESRDVARRLAAEERYFADPLSKILQAGDAQ